MLVSRKQFDALVAEVGELKNRLTAIDEWIAFQIAEKQQALTEQQSGRSISTKDSSGRLMGKGRKE